jgi:phosphomannomutase
MSEPPAESPGTPKRIGVAADHGGFELKEYLVGKLREAGHEVIDFGDRQPKPEDDYPDFVVPLARAVAGGEVERGVAICGSGVGASVAANKVPGVRACLIHENFSAHQGVEDGDLNMICLGGLVVGHALAWELVQTFLGARFSGAERHRRRLGKVMALESQSSPKVIGTFDNTGEVPAPDVEAADEKISNQAEPLKIYFVRHGETEWSLSGQYTGRADIPLTAQGEDEARAVGQRLRDIPFAHVLTSPLQRAQQTCALAALGPTPRIEPDLAEWDNGDDEGRTPAEILKLRPGWNQFRDGSPNGEAPAQISDRADRFIAQLRTLDGNVALFSHSHFGRVLAARWIGLSVEQAEPFLLSTSSISVLCYAHDRTDHPAIALWNSVAPESLVPETNAGSGERSVLKQRAIQRWENEGGEIPNVPTPHPGTMSAVRSPGKKLFIFDLDGTLAESKAALDAEMAALLKTLLGQVKVAVISGGDWPQFESQLLANLSPDANLKNLSLLPTCGTKFYQFDSDWQQLYAEDFTKAEKEKIIRSLEAAVTAEDFGIKETWGEQIEDRGSQITFSALGQRAPLEQKEKWDADFTKRKKIKALLKDLIPEFTVRLGGTTSIDVTKLGIDKAYGIKKLREILGIELEEMLFAGDALFPGGNDYPVKEAGVVSIQVNNAEETKRVIETFLASGAGIESDARREEVAR